MDRETTNGDIIQAARRWVEAKRSYEAGTRGLQRPANYGELKADVRKAERDLRLKVEMLERMESR